MQHCQYKSDWLSSERFQSPYGVKVGCNGEPCTWESPIRLQFQSPYGVKVGCNEAIQLTRWCAELRFNHLTELKSVATRAVVDRVAQSVKGFNHLTELKSVATRYTKKALTAMEFQSPYGVKVGCNSLPFFHHLYFPVFQSPYGVKVGCNYDSSSGTNGSSESFNHLTELKSVATDRSLFLTYSPSAVSITLRS